MGLIIFLPQPPDCWCSTFHSLFCLPSLSIHVHSPLGSCSLMTVAWIGWLLRWLLGWASCPGEWLIVDMKDQEPKSVMAARSHGDNHLRSAIPGP